MHFLTNGGDRMGFSAPCRSPRDVEVFVTRAPFLLILAAVPCLAAELKPEAAQAYDRYTHDTEARLAAAKPFLWVDLRGKAR